MDAERRGGRLGSFLIGGLLGSAAGLAAAGRVRVKTQPKRTTPAGLAAFEQAPCYRELLDRETAEQGRDDASPRR